LKGNDRIEQTRGEEDIVGKCSSRVQCETLKRTTKSFWASLLARTCRARVRPSYYIWYIDSLALFTDAVIVYLEQTLSITTCPCFVFFILWFLFFVHPRSSGCSSKTLVFLDIGSDGLVLLTFVFQLGPKRKSKKKNWKKEREKK
jgi:hypothetical protein